MIPEGEGTVFDRAARAVSSGTDPFVAARSVVAEMTPDERLWCLDGDLPFWAGLGDLGTGGYHRRPFPAARSSASGVPGFAFSDGPRGVVIGPATCFPVSMARGATWDVDLEERVGDAIGRELRAVGATLYGGVCVNVLRHPAWGRAQETYGEDPLHVGELGAALTPGGAATRNGMREAPGVQLDRELALPRRCHGRRGEPARGVPPPLPPHRRRGCCRGDERLQLGERAVVRREP